MNVLEELRGLREKSLKYKNIMYQIHDDEYDHIVTAEMENFHADFVNRLFTLSDRMDEIEKELEANIKMRSGRYLNNSGHLLLISYKKFYALLRGEE